MQWCNCNHNDYYDLNSSVNEFGNEGRPSCSQCGNPINNEDMILLLLKEVKRLKISIEDLEFEKMERDTIKNEEAIKESENMKRIVVESNRFDMLDL